MNWDPYKWMEADWDKWRQDYKFTAFGAGRHTCMGRRFALMQIRTIMSYIFRNFTLEPRCAKPEIHETNMVCPPETAMAVAFKRIQPNSSLLEAWNIETCPKLL